MCATRAAKLELCIASSVFFLSRRVIAAHAFRIDLVWLLAKAVNLQKKGLQDAAGVREARPGVVLMRPLFTTCCFLLAKFKDKANTHK